MGKAAATPVGCACASTPWPKTTRSMVTPGRGVSADGDGVPGEDDAVEDDLESVDAVGEAEGVLNGGDEFAGLAGLPVGAGGAQIRDREAVQ